MAFGQHGTQSCCSVQTGTVINGINPRNRAWAGFAPSRQHRHDLCHLKHIKQSKSLRSIECGAFGWFKGKQKSSEVPAAEVHEAVNEHELPFPTSILDNTRLRGRQLALAYKASHHGWGALQFHKRCDRKGPCVIYCETEQGARFGGFNCEGFRSSNDYASSSDAFLYCWTASKQELIMLRKVGGTEAALFDYARGGPQWGADALIIGPPQAPVMGGIAGPDSPTSGAGDLHAAKSRLGLAYENLPKESQQTSLFGGSHKTATLREVEVYFCPEIAALYQRR